MSNHHEQDEIHQDTLQPHSVAPKENQEERRSDVGSPGRQPIHRAWPVFGRGWKRRLPKMHKKPVLGLALLLGGVVVVGFVWDQAERQRMRMASPIRFCMRTPS